MSGRLAISLRAAKKIAQILVSIGVVRSRRECQLVLDRCVRGAVLRLIGYAEIVSCFRVIDFDGKCSFIVDDRVLDATERMQGMAEIVVRFSKFGIDCESFPIALDCLVMTIRS